MRLRDQFLGIASHELKNPLTVLQGSAQLLALRLGKRADLGDRERRMLVMLGGQTARMRRLIDTMLDVSRIDSGRLSIERAPVDLAALVERIIGEAALPFDTPRLALEREEGVLFVDGDALRLEQVVQNLLQNALRYSADTAPVTVRVGRAGERAIVAVADRGSGIPATALPQIFERFFRAGQDGATRGGMGIGLFVVREIVALHDGEIAVTSVEGEGSTFTVSLPLVPADGESLDAPETSGIPHLPPGERSDATGDALPTTPSLGRVG